MNENFEQDEIIQALRQAAKPTKAPKLSETLLETASQQAPKATLRERLALASNQTRFSFAGAAAILVVSALTLGSLNSGHANIHISLGASGASGASSMATDKMASDTQSPGNSFMTNFPGYNYIADPALSQSTGSAQVYRVEPAQSADEIMNQLSGYFKLNGKVDKSSWSNANKSQNTSLSLTDGNQSIYVDSQLGQFGYSNQDAVGWGPCIREGKANVTVDKNLNPNGTTDASAAPTTYCEEHGSYANTHLPSDADAKAQAIKIFADLGFGVSESEISLDRYNDPSFATLTATAAMKADGMPTSFEWTIGWANTGEIESVSGYQLKLVGVGGVSTISPKAAVERLSDYRWNAWLPQAISPTETMLE